MAFFEFDPALSQISIITSHCSVVLFSLVAFSIRKKKNYQNLCFEVLFRTQVFYISMVRSLNKCIIYESSRKKNNLFNIPTSASKGVAEPNKLNIFLVYIYFFNVANLLDQLEYPRANNVNYQKTINKLRCVIQSDRIKVFP